MIYTAIISFILGIFSLQFINVSSENFLPQVAIFSTNQSNNWIPDSYKCPGSRIAYHWIITSASCVYNRTSKQFEKTYVLFQNSDPYGNYDGAPVESIHVHKTLMHDIALLRLWDDYGKTSLPDNTQVWNLMNQGSSYANITLVAKWFNKAKFSNPNLTSSITNPGDDLELVSATAKIFKYNSSQKILSVSFENDIVIPCKSFKGSPLVFNNSLYAVANFTKKNCNRSNKKKKFTYILPHLEFINNIMNGKNVIPDIQSYILIESKYIIDVDVRKPINPRTGRKYK